MNRTALKLATAAVLAVGLTGAVGAPAFAEGYGSGESWSHRHHQEPSDEVEGGNGGPASNECINLALSLLSGNGIGLLGGKGTGGTSNATAECNAASVGGSASSSDH